MPDGAYILTNFLTAGQTTIIITERSVPYICVGMLPTNLLFFRSATETRPMNQFRKLYKIEDKHAVQPRSHDLSSSCSGAPLFPPPTPSWKWREESPREAVEFCPQKPIFTMLWPSENKNVYLITVSISSRLTRRALQFMSWDGGDGDSSGGGDRATSTNAKCLSLSWRQVTILIHLPWKANGISRRAGGGGQTKGRRERNLLLLTDTPSPSPSF